MSLYAPYGEIAEVPSFDLSSDTLVAGAEVPLAQRSGILGAGGADVSPHLSWSGFPAATQSFTVTVFDPDAPTGSGFWHWAVANIPATTTELALDAGKGGASSGEAGALPASAITLKGDSSHARYIGSAPPPGHGPHRYFFTVHALDVPELEIDAQATPAFLGFNLFFHTVARATIIGTYENLG